MNEQEAIARMVAPGTKRPGKYRQGVIQIWVTRNCDKSCFNCTQGSNYRAEKNRDWAFISLENFELAVKSLRTYFGVVGIFGGNPAIHPEFDTLCEILERYIPWEQRGLWCNNPLGKGKTMRRVFNPSVSNLNVHLDAKAFNEFKRDWPESNPVGATSDSRHSPVYTAMKDLIADEGTRWNLISSCDINQHWSAMIGQFRGEVRAWFCEIAGAQSMLNQNDPSYPDTGKPLVPYYDLNNQRREWWELPIDFFSDQIRKHCHDCGVPLRGYGELACSSEGKEQITATYANVAVPKKPGRELEIVTTLEELKAQAVGKMTDYLGNARKVDQ